MTVDAAKEAAPMKDLHPYRISDAARQAFHEDGVVCLRGLLEAAALEGLRSAIDRHLQPDGWYFQYIYMWQKDSVLADVCFHSSLPQAASQLLGANKLNLIHDQVFVKDRASDERTDWHNDGPYWPIKGPALSIWLAVDEVNEDTGRLEFLRGSHLWNRWFSTTGPISPGEDNPHFEAPFDFDTEGHDYETLAWNLAPGDAVVFHKLTVHGANAYRREGFKRRAYAVRFADNNATYTDEAGAAPHFCNPDLREGQRLDSDQYPVVLNT